MLAAVLGLFGLVVGSFLNVAILRFGVKSIGGRSACVHCGAHLRPFELIPLLSYVALLGRCTHCRARISPQYPLVEASTGILFALVGAASLPLFSTLLALGIVSLLICIFVFDLYHTLIPDAWVVPFSLLALLFSASLIPVAATFMTLMLLLSGPLAALPLFLLWAYSRGAWMGFGDVKLALGIGFLLGMPFGVEAVFFAFVIGAVVSVCILLPLPRLLAFCGLRGKRRSGGYTMKSEVPFGPFLIASCLLVWFALLYNVPLPFPV